MWPVSRSSEEGDLAVYWIAVVRGRSENELARLRKPIESDLVATIARLRSDQVETRADSGFVVELEGKLAALMVVKQGEFARFCSTSINGANLCDGPPSVSSVHGSSGTQFCSMLRFAAVILLVTSLLGFILFVVYGSWP